MMFFCHTARFMGAWIALCTLGRFRRKPSEIAWLLVISACNRNGVFHSSFPPKETSWVRLYDNGIVWRSLALVGPSVILHWPVLCAWVNHVSLQDFVQLMLNTFNSQKARQIEKQRTHTTFWFEFLPVDEKNKPSSLQITALATDQEHTSCWHNT